jgi:hypothetical protein
VETCAQMPRIVDIARTPLPLLHDLWIERALPIPWHVDRDLAHRVRDHRFATGTHCDQQSCHVRERSVEQYISTADIGEAVVALGAEVARPGRLFAIEVRRREASRFPDVWLGDNGERVAAVDDPN